MSHSAEINLNLHFRQGTALNTEANEVLYGGAAGGGKSHLMRVAAIIWCAAIGGLQVYLFRRIRDDLVKNHMEGPKGFRSILAPWVLCGFVKIVEDEIRFWNGSKIYLCHCKDEKDIYKYQGAEIHVLLIDELTHFTEAMYRFLRNRLRMVGLEVPKQYAGMFPRILAGANPGNIGHLWVKATWIDSAEPYEQRRMEPSEGGMLREFVPARLEDNPSMASDDPDYENRLEGLGSKQLVQAMRWGDWDIIEGAYFDCWDKNRHVVQPFEIPKDWTRFASMDWGSAKPFSVGWWGVVSDQIKVMNHMDQPLILPRGCLVRYREWYGAKAPNEGLKLHAEQVGKGIKERENGERMSYRVIDPAAFTEDGGHSIADRMRKETKGKVHFKRADNSRVSGRGPMGGWDQMRARFVGDDDGNPLVVTFTTCHDSIRTIPALQHDKNRPEDVDTDGEDHAGDEWRYACNSRPLPRKAKTSKPSSRTDYRRRSMISDSDSYRTAT